MPVSPPLKPRPIALLAEDDLDIQQVLAGFLEVLGYDVIAASDGSEALDALASSMAAEHPSIDVIVTDIRMPGMNGVSIVETLRADGWEQPIVVLSAIQDDAVIARVRRLPRAAFVAKPFDPVVFARTLEELVAPQTVSPPRA